MKHKLFKRFNFELFSEKLEKKDVVQMFNELYRIRWGLASNDDIKFFLENNNVHHIYRKQTLLRYLACNEESASIYTLVILFYLMEEHLFHRLGYFINVLKIFYAEEKSLMLTEVISRFDIGEMNLKIYKSSLEFIYQKELEYIFKHDESLLGGVKLRWYNGEIDLTLLKKVNRIKTLISQGR